MSIDFREKILEKTLNRKIAQYVAGIHNLIDEKKYNQKLFYRLCDEFFDEILEFFKDKYAKGKKLSEITTEREKIYSEFLQSLFYVAIHREVDTRETNAKTNRKFISNFLGDVIKNNSSRIFYVSYDDNFPHIWQDPKTGMTALLSTIKENYSELTKSLLDLLGEACEKNTLAYKNYLELKDEYGFTAFLSACREGNSQAVKWLFNLQKEFYKDDPNGFQKFFEMCDVYQFNCLHSACKRGHLEIVKFILKQAKQLYSHDKKAMARFFEKRDYLNFNNLGSAIKEAGWHDRANGSEYFHEGIEIALVLFDEIEDIYPNVEDQLPYFIDRDKYNFSPFHAMCKHNQGKLFSHFLKKIYQLYPTPNERKFFYVVQDDCGFTCFHTAVKEGNFDIVKRLLSEFDGLYEIDKLNPQYMCDHLGYLNLLFIPDKYGFTVLHTIADRGWVEIFDELLERLNRILKNKENKIILEKFKEFFEHKNEEGFNALIAGCNKAQFYIVEKLLKMADFLYKDDSQGFDRFFLEKNKAGFNAMSAFCKSILESPHREENYSLKIFNEVLQRIVDGAKHSLPLSSVLSRSYSHVLRTASDPHLKYKEYFKQKTSDFGFNILHTACKAESYKMVELILNTADTLFKSDPKGYMEFLTSQDTSGYSPLIASSRSGNVEIFKLILNRIERNCLENALITHIDQPNKDGFTPLLSACFIPENKYEDKEYRERKKEIAFLLLERGADRYKKTRKKQTANFLQPEWLEEFDRIHKNTLIKKL